MSDEHDFEHRTETTRRAAAALLRDLADGIDAGEVALDHGERAVTVHVPDSVSLELEVERVAGTVELEAELDWPDDDSVAVAEAPSGEGGDAGDDEAAEAVEGPDIPDVLTGAEGPSGSRATFEVYRDRADEWRWRLVHDNGNIIADGGEGYGRKATAINGLRSVQHNAPGADVTVED